MNRDSDEADQQEAETENEGVGDPIPEHDCIGARVLLKSWEGKPGADSGMQDPFPLYVSV